jgi:hypothetical protein
MDQQTNPVVVMGTHRSGTSVLAGCLRLLGINLGQNLISDTESDKSQNYPQNSDVILIHDILLRDLECRWDMIGNLPDDWQTSKAADTAREKIVNLIDREFAKSTLWAISDPRLCKFLPLWLDIFSKKGLSPGIVLMVRHPYEVAASLQNKNGIDLLKGHLLWLASNRQALAELRQHNHAIVTYDRLLADPVSCLETIAHELNLDFPISLAGAYQDIISYIRPELKHEHNSQAVSGQKGKNAFAHYAWFYDQFRMHQSRLIASRTEDQSASEPSPAAKTSVQNLAVFPLVSKPAKTQRTSVDTSHAAEMFDNLLSLIRSYEQAELDTEIRRQRLLLEADHQEPLLYARICLPVSPDHGDVYPYENAKKILLAPEEWQKISVDINDPDPLRQNRIRLDPLNSRGIIRIQSLAIVNAATDEQIWSVPGSAGFDQCAIEGQALVLDRRQGLVMCATGKAPRLFLPLLPDLPDAPLRFEAWVKAGRNLDQITDLWAEKQNTIKKLRKEIQTHQKQLEETSRQYEHSKTHLEQVRAELQQILSENEKFFHKWQERKEQLKQEKQILEEKLSEKEAQIQEREERKNALKEEKQTLEQYLRENEEYKNQLELQMQELKDKLAFQEDLTRQYFTELSKSESQLVAVQDRAEIAESRNRETSKLINQLQKDHAALVSSARWRWGNRLVRFVEVLMFRKKQPLAVDHMQQLLAGFDQTGKKQKKPDQSLAPRPHTAYGTFYGEHDIKTLNSWLRQLQNDHKLLKGSARWKLGNAIIRAIELLAFKRRQTMAIDHMEQIFKEYQEQSADYPVQNIKKLQSWLRQAKNDFYALKKSMRWRTGDRVFSIIDILLFRWKKQTAMDHALKIAAEYEKWENKKA